MTQGRLDRTGMLLQWSGRYFFRFVIAMAVLVVFARSNPVPALDHPALHIGGPVVLAGLVGIGAIGKEEALLAAWIAAGRGRPRGLSRSR